MKQESQAYSDRSWLLYIAIGYTVWALGLLALMNLDSLSEQLVTFIFAILLSAPFICASFAFAYLILSLKDYSVSGEFAVLNATAAIALSIFWSPWLVALPQMT